MVDNSQDTVQGSFLQDIEYPIIAKEYVGEPTDPLSLSIEDDELVRIVDKRIDASKRFYEEKYNLSFRRKKNETYYFGRQIVERERRNDLKPYEARNQDNVLYEIEASLKPLAMSRLPDLIVMPGNESKESAESAEEVTKAVDNDIKKREHRQVLGIAFKHLPVYFLGVIKARWVPEEDDYCFSVVHPENIIVDHTCPTNDADKMQFVAEALPITVQEMVMRFPEKKEKLFNTLREKGLMVGEEPTWKELATTVKIWEVWSTWYVKAKKDEEIETDPVTPEEPQATREDEWERVEGVIWKFYDVVLKKMKNPNFDHEGYTKTVIYDDPADESSKREVTQEDVIQSLMTGITPPGLTQEQMYHNYFDRPRKPYFFLGYDQWRKQPLDETSRIEQNLRNQETLDKRGKQITETLDLRTKNVFSKDGGLTPGDIERMDMNDPNQDILVDGDVTKVHSFIPAPRPTPQEFEDLNSTRSRMYSLAGTSATRGTVLSDTATSNQIAREADFTRADDLVEDTINAASEWMAQWALQFIKLRYTEEHLRKILGAKGKVTFLKLNRDMVEDGMEVLIKSSGTDKLKAQRNAMDMAKLNMIDPITFFEDMDLDDPEGRAEKLLAFQTDPASYIVKFIQGLGDTPQQIDALLGPGATGQLLGQTPAVSPGVPEVPTGSPVQPTPTDTTAAPLTPPMGAPEGSPRGL